jgi:hypothetical protein
MGDSCRCKYRIATGLVQEGVLAIFPERHDLFMRRPLAAAQKQPGRAGVSCPARRQKAAESALK